MIYLARQASHLSLLYIYAATAAHAVWLKLASCSTLGSYIYHYSWYIYFTLLLLMANLSDSKLCLSYVNNLLFFCLCAWLTKCHVIVPTAKISEVSFVQKMSRWTDSPFLRQRKQTPIALKSHFSENTHYLQLVLLSGVLHRFVPAFPATFVTQNVFKAKTLSFPNRNPVFFCP